MKVSREIKTAILVIVSILIFIWGYGFLKGKDLFSSYRTFYAIYDNVEGLPNSALVTLNGLTVGKVYGISLLHDGKLLVEIRTNSDFPISKNAILQIYEPGFISGKQIAIIPDFYDDILAEDGDTLHSSVKQGMFAEMGNNFTPLQKKIETTLTSVDTLLNNINALLNTQNKKNISVGISEITQITQTLNKTTKQLSKLLTTNQENIDQILSDLSVTTGNLAEISSSVSQADFKNLIKNLENTANNVNEITSQINSGKGTLGKLATDDQMYNNLTKTSKELELLLQDLRLNPTRYINVSVFGKKNKPYVTPKETQQTPK